MHLRNPPLTQTYLVAAQPRLSNDQGQRDEFHGGKSSWNAGRARAPIRIRIARENSVEFDSGRIGGRTRRYVSSDRRDTENYS